MPRPSSHSASLASDPHHSAAPSPQETLFLLSISRDEDDDAALRADLKRSSLRNYKIQHCANLDDALHLLRVCGFDVVFIRLDDFQDKQTAVNLVKQHGSDQTLIALVTSRLLANPAFAIPTGIDATCRVEDLSPSLVATLVTASLDRKRSRAKQTQAEQELQLALEAAELGRWSLHIESGRLELDTAAAMLLGALDCRAETTVDAALTHAYPEDHDKLKKAFAQAIENGDDLQVSFRLAGTAMPLPQVELFARHADRGDRRYQRLFGVVKRREANTDLRDRLSKANESIQRAVALRDEAVATASAELQAIAELLGRPPMPALGAPPAPSVAPDSLNAPQATQSAPEGEALQRDHVENPASPPSAASPNAPEPAAQTALPKDPEQEPALEIDKNAAFHNVLRSLARQDSHSSPQRQDTFPFDFSSDPPPDYSDPDPTAEGFSGAAKRLVNITQSGHDLRVSLSIEDSSMVEAECEKDLLFEILRELLTNVVKHARAKECIISLFRDDDDWVLQVEDDGVGLEKNLISISAPLNQIGLFRIRTKLALKGGQLDLTPTAPRGLIARARLPVNLIRSQGKEHA